MLPPLSAAARKAKGEIMKQRKQKKQKTKKRLYIFKLILTLLITASFAGNCYFIYMYFSAPMEVPDLPIVTVYNALEIDTDFLSYSKLYSGNSLYNFLNVNFGLLYANTPKDTLAPMEEKLTVTLTVAFKNTNNLIVQTETVTIDFSILVLNYYNPAYSGGQQTLRIYFNDTQTKAGLIISADAVAAEIIEAGDILSNDVPFLQKMTELVGWSNFSTELNGAITGSIVNSSVKILSIVEKE